MWEVKAEKAEKVKADKGARSADAREAAATRLGENEHSKGIEHRDAAKKKTEEVEAPAASAQ